MSSKPKNSGNKRKGEFENACRKLSLTPRAFFFAAASEANERRGGRHIDQATIVNDFGDFQLAESLGRFEAPDYVHEKIARALGVKPKAPAPVAKSRFDRRQSRPQGFRGVHA